LALTVASLEMLIGLWASCADDGKATTKSAAMAKQVETTDFIKEFFLPNN
jgi:hypothetical protein